jgi:hypothetical protein
MIACLPETAILAVSASSQTGLIAAANAPKLLRAEDHNIWGRIDHELGFVH